MAVKLSLCVSVYHIHPHRWADDEKLLGELAVQSRARFGLGKRIAALAHGAQALVTSLPSVKHRRSATSTATATVRL